MNGNNNPQKSKFQDKGEEESDKVEKNIHEVLISNWTTLVIKARIEPIKGGGEVKYGGGKNLLGGEK